MEYRPHSRPEASADIPPDERQEIHPLTEHYALNRAVTLWSGPKYLNYNGIAARLRAFTTWPSGMNPMEWTEIFELQ
jgi:hypothetical protein